MGAASRLRRVATVAAHTLSSGSANASPQNDLRS
jgi:hypothetical protein